MKLGFSLTIIGLILLTTSYSASGMDLSEFGLRIGPLEYHILQWIMILGGGLFILGLVRIMAKSIERNNNKIK
ncbi:hypothetical protein [Dehalococcoides mccartyi]|uniref:Uncharacterized protein n=1 Tax=Dehalococcoides mccartyi (strain CBDB1) TaxID=255470 RepID=A0A916NZL2_DEHMC|nr:hypothetical protein [Dehalococcoides mccartyi]CAI83536.1 hypothetical protein cbdbA1513 [Dehalococcoides mccartyi CBDB1]